MENIITQVGAPVKNEAHTIRKGGNNDAQGFAREMDDAVKNSEEGKPMAASTVESGRNDAQAAGEEANSDMKETADDDSAVAGLVVPTASIDEDVALDAVSGETLKAAETVAGALAVVAAGPGEEAAAAVAEDMDMKVSNVGTTGHKYTSPNEMGATAEAAGETGDEVKTPEDDCAGADMKAAAQEKGLIKGGLAAVATAQQAIEADGAGEAQDAKSAAAAGLTAGHADETPDGALGNGGGEEKGNYAQAGQRAGGAAPIAQINGQAPTYEAVAKGTELTFAERAEVFERLSSGVRVSVARDGGEVKLSLRPDHLGNLNIKLNIEDGNVNARIVVESAAVKAALDADSTGLREVFSKNNLVLDKYTVEVAERDFSFDRETSGFSGFEKGRREGFLSSNNRHEVLIQEIGSAAGITTPVRASGIDLFI